MPRLVDIAFRLPSPSMPLKTGRLKLSGRFFGRERTSRSRDGVTWRQGLDESCAEKRRPVDPFLFQQPARALRAVMVRRDGAVAVEFALAAMPFIFMLFAIIESGLIFVAQIDLSNATMMVARQVRTGNLVAAGLTSNTSGTTLSLADFKTAICNAMNFIPTSTCTTQLQIDLRTQSSFGSGQTASSPVNNLNFNNASLCYYSGQGGSIVELRAFYLWQVNTPLILSPLVNATSYTSGQTTTSGKYHVITSAEAFRVEQNSSGANNGSSC